MKNQSQLLEVLSACITACENCAASCLEEENIQHLVKCIKTDIDCADICTVTYRFVSRHSSRSSAILTMCANICDACADECEKHDMDHCRECAKRCRECAEACRAAA